MTRQANSATMNDSAYYRMIGTALDQTLQDTITAEQKYGLRSIDINTARFVIFSDLHRGNRDGADDFKHSERAYNAALAYYYRMGHTLVTLGDVEELWEVRTETALKAYRYTLYLESKFHRDGRYIRFWGNHDDDWQYPEEVSKHLDPLYGGEPLIVHEGLRLQVMDGEEELGTFFLAHGHQGTAESDRFAFFSKAVVRYLWRPFQRVTGLTPNTMPSSDWRLREQHNMAMYHWASTQDRLILITGHTHRPVFESQTHAMQIREELDVRIRELAKDRNNPKLIGKIAALEAQLEWIRAQNQQIPGLEGGQDVSRPAYFNTGCCCYSDGDITGLEIVDGEIRLIRWPDQDDSPQPQILAKASLRKTFSACQEENM